jgi:hypothetical protein
LLSFAKLSISKKKKEKTTGFSVWNYGEFFQVFFLINYCLLFTPGFPVSAGGAWYLLALSVCGVASGRVV